MQLIRTIDDKFYDRLGLAIRSIRKSRKLTLYDMSKITGYSRALIDHWELGYSKIKPNQFDKLCKALGIKPKIRVEVTVGDIYD